MSTETLPARTWLVVLLLAALSFGLFFHGTGRRHLWSPDEDEYIVVNREMVEEGRWIHPTANGKPYSIKPPLFNWLGSGFSVLAGGVSEHTSRLPSAFAAMAGVFLAWRLGRRMFGERAGLLAALILATTPLYVEFSRWIQVNMLSTVLNLWVMSMFWWGYTTPRHRVRAYLLMNVPIGLGVLNMGPVNVVMPALVIGTFLLVVRDFRHVLSLRLPWGILIVLAIAGPWYFTVCQRPEYREGLLVVTNFDRFFTDSVGHVRPFWYYLKTTPAYFLPWTFFVPSAVMALRTVEGEEDRKPLLFLLVWVASLFVFFSFSKTKRSEYLLPVFPALALLAGYVIDRGVARGVHSGRWRNLLVWPVRLTLALVILTGIGGPILLGLVWDGWFVASLPAAALLVAGGLVTGLLFRRGRPVAAVAALAVMAAVLVAGSTGGLIEQLDRDRSVAGFCAKVAPRFPEGSSVRQYRYGAYSFSYYLRRPLRRCGKPEVLREWLSEPDRVYVIVKERHWEAIRHTLPEDTSVVHRERVNRRDILLISNRPD